MKAQANVADNIIEVRDVRNQFGSQVVHDALDLDVRRGEILSIVGGSGTGKSVLLRTIVGLNRPRAGKVRVFGEDLLALPPARRMASTAEPRPDRPSASSAMTNTTPAVKVKRM